MQRIADQRGATLVDTLVVATLSVVVLTAVCGFIVAAAQHNVSATGRVDAIDRASFGLQRIETDLRQALEIRPVPGVATPATRVELRRWVRTAGAPEQHWIRLDCGATGTIVGTHACTRRDLTTGTTATVVLDGIAGTTAIFTLRPRPATGAAMAPVGVAVATRAKGRDHIVTMRSTVTPRNCADGIPDGQAVCPG